MGTDPSSEPDGHDGGPARLNNLAPQPAMVTTTSPQPPPSEDLLRLLRQKLELSESAMDLGLRQAELEQAPLPVVFWRLGLINLEQLDQLLSWQDSLGPDQL
jgi:hypothetical protein